MQVYREFESHPFRHNFLDPLHLTAIRLQATFAIFDPDEIRTLSMDAPYRSSTDSIIFTAKFRNHLPDRLI